MDQTTVADLVTAATDELLSAASAEDETRTVHLRNLAHTMADIRALCVDPLGRGSDWGGRSKEYRIAITSVYRAVVDDVPAAALQRIKSQVRYHLSIILRERLSDDVLGEFGLQPQSVRDRHAYQNRRQRALEAAGIVHDGSDDPNTASRLVHGARHLVALAAEEGTDDLTTDAADYVRDGVRQIIEQVPDLTRDEDRVTLARDLLATVEPSSLGRLSQSRKAAVDEVLTELLSAAERLQRETTSVEAAERQLARLQSALSSKRSRR